jgi:hypothetical protein
MVVGGERRFQAWTGQVQVRLRVLACENVMRVPYGAVSFEIGMGKMVPDTVVQQPEVVLLIRDAITCWIENRSRPVMWALRCLAGGSNAAAPTVRAARCVSRRLTC